MSIERYETPTAKDLYLNDRLRGSTENWVYYCDVAEELAHAELERWRAVIHAQQDAERASQSKTTTADVAYDTGAV